jgi:hypothetical protein
MLELSPDEMHALGYRAVDMMVDHLSALPHEPAFNTATRGDGSAPPRAATGRRTRRCAER